MAENSAIEWCDHTFNPWEGCQKVGPGCDNCYAENRNARWNGGDAVNWGPGAPRRRTSEANWNKPRQWNRKAQKLGVRYRVFCASLADVFDNAVDPSWRADLFELIRETPNLDWLLLTKRIGNAQAMVSAAGGWPANAWAGITVVNQEEANRDIPKLLALEGPPIRFLSCEPLLEKLDIDIIPCPKSLDNKRCPEKAIIHPLFGVRSYNTHRGRRHIKLLRAIDWVIVGGESGSCSRPMHPEWVRFIRDECENCDVPFFFKQHGDWIGLGVSDGRGPTGGTWPVDAASMCTLSTDGKRSADGWPMQRVGKKFAGRLLDGQTHDAFPITSAVESTP